MANNKMKTTKHKITVTIADITRGIPQNPCRCMLARAIRRVLGCRYVSVFPQAFGFGTCCLQHNGDISLPKLANANALLFDAFFGGPKARAEAIKPFSFTLCVPISQ